MNDLAQLAAGGVAPIAPDGIAGTTIIGVIVFVFVVVAAAGTIAIAGMSFGKNGNLKAAGGKAGILLIAGATLVLIVGGTIFALSSGIVSTVTNDATSGAPAITQP